MEPQAFGQNQPTSGSSPPAEDTVILTGQATAPTPASTLWLPHHLCNQVLIHAAKRMSTLNDPPVAANITALLLTLHPFSTTLQRLLSSYLMHRAAHICATGDLACLWILHSFKSRLNSRGFRVALIHDQVRVMDWWADTAKWDLLHMSFLSDRSTGLDASLDFPVRQAAQRGSFAAVRWVVNKYLKSIEDDDVYDFCRTGGGSISDASVADMLRQGGEAREIAVLCLQSMYPMLPANERTPSVCQVCETATQLGLVEVLRLYKGQWPRRECWRSARCDPNWQYAMMRTAIQTGNVEVVKFWVEGMMSEDWDQLLWDMIGGWARKHSFDAILQWWNDPKSVEWAFHLHKHGDHISILS